MSFFTLDDNRLFFKRNKSPFIFSFPLSQRAVPGAWSRIFSELVLIISGVAVLNLFSKMDIH
jgi:hypothetical protein